MKQACLITVFVGVLTSSGMGGAQGAGRELRKEGPVAIAFGKATPLKAILQIAEENKIPLGIVLGPDPVLCAEERPFSIDAADFKGAFSQALAGTGYMVSLESGAYVLVAPDATEHEVKQLNFRFDHFSVTDSTMQDAGQLLAGYIMTSVEGAQGFVTGSMSGAQSRFFTIKMEAATTKEIANRIVSQDGKGAWVFRPIPKPEKGSGGESPIQIFGYEDNSAGLRSLACTAEPQGG